MEFMKQFFFCFNLLKYFTNIYKSCFLREAILIKDKMYVINDTSGVGSPRERYTNSLYTMPKQCWSRCRYMLVTLRSLLHFSCTFLIFVEFYIATAKHNNISAATGGRLHFFKIRSALNNEWK